MSEFDMGVRVQIKNEEGITHDERGQRGIIVATPRGYSGRYANNTDPWLVELEDGRMLSYREASMIFVSASPAQLLAVLGDDYFD